MLVGCVYSSRSLAYIALSVCWSFCFSCCAFHAKKDELRMGGDDGGGREGEGARRSKGDETKLGPYRKRPKLGRFFVRRYGYICNLNQSSVTG